MSQVVEVELLGRTQRIVTQNKPELVQASAALVRDKMNELRSAGAVVGGERLLLLVALNLAEDLLQRQHLHDDTDQGLTSDLESIVSQAEALANAPLR
ncbi:MAG: cell division protein ZapA [Mariprofundales bacterium]